MLVLTRRTGEAVRLQVGEEMIWILLVHQECGRVRLGFEAAPHVKIMREELLPAAEARLAPK